MTLLPQITNYFVIVTNKIVSVINGEPSPTKYESRSKRCVWTWTMYSYIQYVLYVHIGFFVNHRIIAHPSTVPGTELAKIPPLWKREIDVPTKPEIRNPEPHSASQRKGLPKASFHCASCSESVIDWVHCNSIISFRNNFNGVGLGRFRKQQCFFSLQITSCIQALPIIWSSKDWCWLAVSLDSFWAIWVGSWAPSLPWKHYARWFESSDTDPPGWRRCRHRRPNDIGRPPAQPFWQKTRRSTTLPSPNRTE